jgi:hypothetical protein
VAIRASSSQQVDQLVADLERSENAREAAVARLTIIGARAVDRLIALAESKATPAARAAAFRTLEAIGDPRAVDAALRAMAPTRDPTVALAAISLARGFLRGTRSAAIVDALTEAALDRARVEPVRVAAVRSLLELEPATIAPLMPSLMADPSAAIVGLARGTGRRKPSPPRRVDPLQLITRAAQDALPDDPVALRDAVAAAGAAAPLPVLLRIVERVREREADESPDRRMEWTTTRGTAHLALARRNSRMALYDLRESLDRADAPPPVEFLTAVSLIGDSSCLEPIAAACARLARAGRPQRDWWRMHLTDAFRAIVAREKLTRRNGVMRKIEKKWPAVMLDMAHG